MPTILCRLEIVMVIEKCKVTTKSAKWTKEFRLKITNLLKVSRNILKISWKYIHFYLYLVRLRYIFKLINRNKHELTDIQEITY